VLGSGASRKQIARTLNVAYERGLLSEETGDRLVLGEAQLRID
jgi:hypothetical protein